MNKPASQTESISTTPNQRRQLLLGAGATLLLSACGGGGGGDSKAKSLREVYDRIEPGMHNEDVTELAGFGPYASGEATWWNLGDEFLIAQWFSPLVTGESGADAYRIRRVTYRNSSTSVTKDLP